MTEKLKRMIQKNQRTEQAYAQLVNKYVRERYSPSQVEAILNNYLDDMTNESHAQEFRALQAYRAECKARAKEELGIE